MDIPFQRRGGNSNSKVGHEFEDAAKGFFRDQGIFLTPSFPLPIGVGLRKLHKFDLGDERGKIIVECKSHRWTETDKVPSAKITTWDQAMLLFLVAPPDYRKILFVLRDFSSRRRESLAEYYVRINPHLIPQSVEIWEFDAEKKSALQIPLTRRPDDFIRKRDFCFQCEKLMAGHDGSVKWVDRPSG